jgi:hypothetical protein
MIMNCSPELSQLLLEILTTGLLRIRALGWSGDAERCAIESDHIHNVPELLAHFSPERLVYYWDVERSSYIKQIPSSQLAVWEPLWRELRIQLDAEASLTSAHAEQTAFDPPQERTP